jgi:hypothetical protein
MKYCLLLLSALTIAVLPSCTETEAKTADRPPENGAQFEKGKGLSLTEEMARFIGLQTADVQEQKLSVRVPVTLRMLPGGKEAGGWLTAAQAEKIPTGATVKFPGDPAWKGTIKRLEKPAFAGMGDYEVTVSANYSLPEGTELPAAILLGETEAAASIPRSALLSTAEGHFVYAVNGDCFFRTAVTVGVTSEDYVEITDGLFAGDSVVSTPVMSLWMAELQVLRGGKACTCGH